MRTELSRLCEQFIENRKRVERAFILSTPQMHCMCALLLGMDDCDADLVSIRRGLRILRKRTPLFSTFRGIGITPIATKLSMCDNPELWINYAKDNLRALKGTGFPATDYLCLASLLMVKRHAQADAIAARAREIFLRMRNAHRILTANEDVCFAVLFSMYEQTYDCVAAEQSFEALKAQFGAINAVQMASNVLLMQGADPKRGAEDTEWLYRRLRESGVRSKSKAELGVLAFLAACEGQSERLVADILDAERYLRMQKGFSAMKLGRSQRILFAACLAAMDRLHGMREDPSYAKSRDTLQGAMLLTVVLSVVQGMAATGI